MAYWTYLTLGVIVALIALGAVAISEAIDRNMALHIKGMETLTEEEEAVAQRICPGAPYAVTDYRVKKYVLNAFYAECSYYHEFVDGRKVERITIHTSGEMVVNGHWSTGYTVSYFGNKDVIVRIDSITKKFLEMKIVRAPIETYNLAYNDDMQKILRFAMQDDLARRFLESDDYYVRNIRYPGNGLGTCYTEPCGDISIDKINSKLNFGIEVNVFEGYPIIVSTGFLYMAPFKIIISNDDPEPIPAFDVKEGQRLDIPLRILGQPSAKNGTVPVRLDATMTMVQGLPNYYERTQFLYGEVEFEYSFSTPEIKIQRTSDLTVSLNLLVPPDLLAPSCAKKETYVLAIRGVYGDELGSLEDKYGGTIAYLNVKRTNDKCQ